MATKQTSKGYFKKSHKSRKSYKYRLSKQEEDELFALAINPQKPVAIKEEEWGLGPHQKKQKSRKNSSNLPTANNSTSQTPKSSFDKNETNYREVSEKLASRKWSKDSVEIDIGTFEEFIPKDIQNCHHNVSKNKADDFKTKYKTELCKFFEINGTCKFGENCAYAHGKENLRTKVTRTSAYRTKKCIQFFENGFCPYGNRCQFAHALKSNIVNNPYEKNISYRKLLETLETSKNIESDSYLFPNYRLSSFEEIVNNSEINRTLLVDIKELSKDDLFTKVLENDVKLYNESEELLSAEEEEKFCKSLGL